MKQENLTECHIYTDSWSVANGLAAWLPMWVRNNWQIHPKELWGKELWADIWEIVQKTNASVFHVDAHSIPNSTERWYNSITDKQTRIQMVEVNPNSSELKGLALWAHQKCGHLGEKATYRLFLES